MISNAGQATVTETARLEPAGATGQFRIDGELDFASVPLLYLRSQEMFPDCPELTLDLAGVTRANSAGLALLLEWLGQSRRAGRALTFENVPPGLINLAYISELEDILPLHGRPATGPAGPSDR